MSRSALCSLYGYGRAWGINRDTIIRSTIRTEQGYGRVWGINRDTVIWSLSLIHISEPTRPY